MAIYLFIGLIIWAAIIFKNKKIDGISLIILPLTLAVWPLAIGLVLVSILIVSIYENPVFIDFERKKY